MVRLPQPGGDVNSWGVILNEFLTTAHKNDGTLKNGVVNSATLEAGAPSSGQVLGYNGSALSWTTPSGSGSVPDATNSVKGLIQLAGDLGGTSASPTVPGLATKADTSALTAHTSSTTNPHSVTKAQVGLGNADNTSDLNKPISTATQAALNLKAALASPTFTGSVTVPTPLTAMQAANKSYVDGVVASGASNATTTSTGLIQLAGDLGGTATSPTVPGLASKADVSALNLRAPLASPTFTGSVVVPTPTTDTQAANKSYVDGVVASGAANATTTSTGLIQLAGDLGGTATSPTVPGLAGKANTSHTHAASDIASGTIATARLGSGTANNTTFLRGDNTWATPPAGGGGGGITVVARNTDYTANANEFIIGDASEGAVTITLPAAANGSTVSVKKVDASANGILVVPASGQIDNLATDVVNNPWQSQDYISDGAKWYRI